MPRHGEQRNFQRITQEGPEVEFLCRPYADSDEEVVYRGPGSWTETFSSERWCATCQKWVEVKGILGELGFAFEHGHKAPSSTG